MEINIQFDFPSNGRKARKRPLKKQKKGRKRPLKKLEKKKNERKRDVKQTSNILRKKENLPEALEKQLKNQRNLKNQDGKS